MRAILFLFISVLFYSSCSECSCKLGAKNVEVIQSVYSNFASGNIEGVVASFASDIEWNEAENYIYADNNPYIGADAILQGVFGRIGGEWNNFSVGEPTIMPVGNDHVLATGRYTGVFKANSKGLDAQFAHLWKISEGKVISFQQYTDTKQAAEVAAVENTEEETE